MRRGSKAVLAAVLVAFLAGCVQYTLVEPKRQIAMERFSVQPTTSWNRRTGNKSEEWTKDGIGLQTLMFFDEIPDGGTIYAPVGEEKLPTFAANMRANDVVDLLAATMAARGLTTGDVENLQPFSFANLDGFTFDLAISSDGGGQYKGTAYGAIDDGKLYLILYTGHAEYYFDKEKDEVDRIVESLTL